MFAQTMQNTAPSNERTRRISAKAAQLSQGVRQSAYISIERQSEFTIREVAEILNTNYPSAFRKVKGNSRLKILSAIEYIERDGKVYVTSEALKNYLDTHRFGRGRWVAIRE